VHKNILWLEVFVAGHQSNAVQVMDNDSLTVSFFDEDNSGHTKDIQIHNRGCLSVSLRERVGPERQPSPCLQWAMKELLPIRNLYSCPAIEHNDDDPLVALRSILERMRRRIVFAILTAVAFRFVFVHKLNDSIA